MDKQQTSNKVKRMMAVGQSSRRMCPTCGAFTWVTVTTTGDGLERWTCSKNGCLRTFSIGNRVN